MGVYFYICNLWKLLSEPKIYFRSKYQSEWTRRTCYYHGVHAPLSFSSFWSRRIFVAVNCLAFVQHILSERFLFLLENVLASTYTPIFFLSHTCTWLPHPFYAIALLGFSLWSSQIRTIVDFRSFFHLYVFFFVHAGTHFMVSRILRVVVMHEVNSHIMYTVMIKWPD